MAKKKKSDAAEGEEEGKKGGKGKLIVPVVLLLIGLFAGKMFFAPKKSAEQMAAAAKAAHQVLVDECNAANGVTVKTADGTTPTTAAPAAPNPVLEMDPITINLAGGNYLKVGLALQLKAGADASKAKDDGLGAKALDMAIAAISPKSMDQLADQQARDALKQDLAIKTCIAYDGEVQTVYFTDFVMQ
jgi:flagellar basal body-associated protein FliL